MALSNELQSAILTEMARLSMAIYIGDSVTEARGFAMLINHLIAVFVGKIDISDFHEEISEAPTEVREYYYKLLYLIK